jgi:hypothetical protein
MFEFMLLQCIAVVLIVVFPKIVTTFPEQMRAEGAAVTAEEVDDSANRLEEDPLLAVDPALQLEQQEGQQEEQVEEQQEEESLEKDELVTPKK